MPPTPPAPSSGHTAARDPHGPVLLVSATPSEARGVRVLLQRTLPARLAWGEGVMGRLGAVSVCLAHLGIGKANTAAGVALAIERLAPRCVVQFGVGGTFAGAFLPVGAAAAASCEVNTDTGAGEGAAWEDLEALGFPLLPGPPARYNELPTDPELTAALASSGGLPTVRFATSERVTGTLDEAERIRRRHDVSVESMEGAAAAQVCLALDVPFAEIRGVSNVVGERDRHAWNLPGAVRAACDAVVRGVLALEPVA